MFKSISILSLLLAYFVAGDNCFALDKGTLVYATKKFVPSQLSYNEAWRLYRYVRTSDDCMIISPVDRADQKTLLRRYDKFGAIIMQGQLEVGGEVYYKFSPIPKYRVEIIGVGCHLVEDKDDSVASRSGAFIYVPLTNMVEQKEFEKLIGLRKKIVIKEEVLRHESGTEDGWKPAVVSAERNDCFVTESGKILYGDNTIFIPSKPSKEIKAGDHVLRRSNDIDGTPLNIWQEKVVESVLEKKATMVAEQDEDGSLMEPETLDTVSLISINQGTEEISYWPMVKPGTEVFLYVNTESCQGQYYERHKVTSVKRNCYLLYPSWYKDDSNASDAEIPDRLISVKDLDLQVANPK